MDVRRIDRTRLNRTSSKKKTETTGSVSFEEIMAKGRAEKTVEKLTAMVEEIEEQGKILAESRTVEELRKYKQLVKEFMDDAIKHGLSLEERRGFNRRGRTKIYKIVKEVDARLIDLTNAVLDKEKKSLEILDMVGEIKGLLINLYT